MRSFARVVEATGDAPLDLTDAALFAIAIAEEAALLLKDTDCNREQVRRASEGGLLPSVAWIGTEPDEPTA